MHLYSNDLQLTNVNILGKVKRDIKYVWFGVKSISYFQEESKFNLCKFYKNYDF